MNLLEMDDLSPHSSPTLGDDVLIKQILLSHDPDGRHFDSELLLQLTESIMYHATASQVSVQHFKTIEESTLRGLEIVGSQESLELTLYQISYKMLWESYEERNLHARTMILFDFLSKYKWEAKLVLVLAALATSYGRVWLILKLSQHTPLAVSIAKLKQLPGDLNPLDPQLKALTSLVKTMGDAAKNFAEFEGLAFENLNIDTTVAKSHIYIAAYWVIRSALTCSAHIRDLAAVKHKPSNSATIAAWELSSLVYRLSSICSFLRMHVDECHRQIEMKVSLKLLNLFKETHTDNQEVLHMLFALKDKLPLKKGFSKEKIRISELKNKFVILLLSRPELIAKEELLLLLAQQTHEHPYKKKLDGSYEIVWVPIPSSQEWTEAEKSSFNLLSNSLPWYSVRLPWLLSPAVANYIKQEWNFKVEPIMVVLDSQGMVTNRDAISMVLIWGDQAYPFSKSKEEELWEKEKWTLQLIINQIDPLLTYWVQEGRNLCIYGSCNPDWIREFNSKIKEIKRTGLQLEVVFVGTKSHGEQARNILCITEEDKLSSFLSFTKMQFFWLRLESIRRSKVQLEKTTSGDQILEEVEALLNYEDTHGGWVLMGAGHSEDIVRLQGTKVMECLDLFPVWGGNVTNFGLLGAVRATLSPRFLPAEPCNHSKVIPYDRKLIEGNVLCESCMRPMEKCVVFECNVMK